jgi:pilus assembly protein Flp/PilA
VRGDASRDLISSGHRHEWEQSVMQRYRSEDGATAVEYGIMVALIAVVIIGAVALLGQNLQSSFSQVDGCIEAPVPCADES